MPKSLWFLPPIMLLMAFFGGGTIGYKIGVVGWLEKEPPAPVRADMVFSDWGSSANTNPNGLYLHNTSNSPLWCKLKETNGIEIQPHMGFWLAGAPGPFYDCTVTDKKGTKRPAKKRGEDGAVADRDLR